MNPYALVLVVALYLLPLALIGGLIRWSAAIQRRRTAANLQRLATQLGMEFISTGSQVGQMRVTGPLRGKKVEFFNYMKNIGKSRLMYSAVTAQVTVDALTFLLTKRTSFSKKLEKLIGGRGVVTVGDAEFDKRWFVQANQPEFMGAALIPELRMKLMRYAGKRGMIQLKGGEVRYEEFGAFSEAKRIDRFVALADVVCDLASVAEVAAERSGKAEG